MLTTRANWQGVTIGLIAGIAVVFLIVLAKAKCAHHPGGNSSHAVVGTYANQHYITNDAYDVMGGGGGGGSIGYTYGEGSWGGGGALVGETAGPLHTQHHGTFGPAVENGSGNGTRTSGCHGIMRVGDITFYWYGALLTCTTFIVGFLSSLMFPPPSDEMLADLTVWTLAEPSPHRAAAADDSKSVDELVKPLLNLGTESQNQSIQ